MARWKAALRERQLMAESGWLRAAACWQADVVIPHRQPSALDQLTQRVARESSYSGPDAPVYPDTVTAGRSPSTGWVWRLTTRSALTACRAICSGRQAASWAPTLWLFTALTRHCSNSRLSRVATMYFDGADVSQGCFQGLPRPSLRRASDSVQCDRGVAASRLRLEVRHRA